MMTPAQHQPQCPPIFSLRKRVQLCIAMLALECYISFEEIFMLAVLQRVQVPVVLVSLPGTISSAVGVFVIPLLGWASDRPGCGSKHCGQKRPFALWTLVVSMVGVSILIYVSSASLYNQSLDAQLAANHSISSERPVSINTGVSAHPDTNERTAFSDTANATTLSNTTDATAFSDTTEFTAVSGSIESISHSDTTELPSPSDATDVSVFPDITETTAVTDTTHVPPLPANTSLSVSQSNVTPAANRPATLPSASTDYVPLMGVLSILGFVLADHGYDSSMSTFKAYMVAVTPQSQHDDVFVMGTLTGAVGGCLTSMLGFVDLASLFPDTSVPLDAGIAQCLVQAVILLTQLLVLGAISLLTGSESMTHEIQDLKPEAETNIDECSHHKPDPKLVHTDTADVFNDNARVPHLESGNTDSGNWPWLGRWKRRILLCVMSFLGLSTNYAYFVYVSNYVAQAIYEGDPNGEAGSKAYGNYVEGVHIASLGMLTFYCLFVLFNIFHKKILAKIGMKVEYLSASIGCSILMLTLAFTDNIIVFFVNAATMAVFRSAVYTIPFILSNNYTKHEFGEGDGNSSGVAMATITAMIPASYFFVSLVMGPLMDATGYPGTPVFIASGCCILGIFSALFVKFD